MNIEHGRQIPVWLVSCAILLISVGISLISFDLNNLFQFFFRKRNFIWNQISLINRIYLQSL